MNKDIKCSAIFFFFSIFVTITLDPELDPYPDSLKMLDPDSINPDPQYGPQEHIDIFAQ
jgi:hypothetical protein